MILNSWYIQVLAMEIELHTLPETPYQEAEIFRGEKCLFHGRVLSLNNMTFNLWLVYGA